MPVPNDDQEQLLNLLPCLDIPSSFSKPDAEADGAISSLQEWKRQAELKLNQLRELLSRTTTDTVNAGENPELPLDKQAEVVARVAAFDGEGTWVTPGSRAAAIDILKTYDATSVPLLRQILSKHVKPIFQANPHPYVNLSTGRKLARAAGGPLAAQDYYESQTWKTHPGLPNLVSWCIRNIKTESWEDLWHLIVPPLMTLLDDYEASYKKCGAELVLQMLNSVPRSVLQRTGIGSLLRTSLSNALTQLKREDSPALIRAAIPASLKLTLHTTDPGSMERFDQLCALLGDGIIGSIWLYSSLDLPALQASVDALPPVLDALGIGCVRYLKALVPQLVYPLLPSSPLDRSWQIASLRALGCVIDLCAPRMHRWKGRVIEGVGKAWVASLDAGSTDEQTLLLQSELIVICQKLAKACPSVVKEEYAALLAAEHDVFEELLSDIVSQPQCKAQSS
ncbi:hypothetical protein HGRIS_003352 [Hohenbuehelia grisea]|uniref:Uncharacterized protein n=1 Tax=Hohenbuehelia grisea TaxID=104357 RepID=A0ABR3JF53_9AGAR